VNVKQQTYNINCIQNHKRLSFFAHLQKLRIIKFSIENKVLRKSLKCLHSCTL